MQTLKKHLKDWKKYLLEKYLLEKNQSSTEFEDSIKYIPAKTHLKPLKLFYPPTSNKSSLLIQFQIESSVIFLIYSTSLRCTKK